MLYNFDLKYDSHIIFLLDYEITKGKVSCINKKHLFDFKNLSVIKTILHICWIFYLKISRTFYGSIVKLLCEVCYIYVNQEN